MARCDSQQLAAAVLLVAALFVLCSTAQDFPKDDCPYVDRPADRRNNTAQLVIVTFNAEWLFLNAWSKNWASFEEAQSHLENIAAVIKAMRPQPDIINLVEVESCSVLTELIRVIGDATYKPYLLKGTDTATGQNVGLITRVDPTVSLQRTANRVSYPVSGTTCTTAVGKGTTAVSKHYYTVFAPTNFPSFLLVAGHFLAYPDDVERCVQREAQAKVISDLVQSEGLANGLEVVVLGDLNDFDGQALDHLSNKPISQVLQFLRDPIPTETTDDMANAAAWAPTADRYTCYWDSQNLCRSPLVASSSIDHILMTSGLSSLISSVSMVHSFSPPCYVDAELNSDHWPVLVTLRARSPLSVQ